MNYVAALRKRGGRWLVGLAMGAILAAVVASSRSQAEVQGQKANDRQIAFTVIAKLRTDHLSKHPLDDEISERTFTTFFKMLDPFKLYFTQSDVDEFSGTKKQLDDLARDLLKRSDNSFIGFAHKVFNRFLERVDQRVQLVDELLGQEQDFTVDEEMVTDPKLTTYATNDTEIKDRWRKRIKYDLLVKKADKIDAQKAKEKISKRYHSFAKRWHQMTGDELLERYLTAFTQSFDPHTSYMSQSSLDNFDIIMRLRLEGIGAALEYDPEDGYTKVARLIPGGAAEKDGRLKPEDRIVGVAQDLKGEFVDVEDMNLNDVVDLIRGPAGTIVRLKVVAADGAEKVIEITRARVELKDSEAQSAIFDAGAKSNGQPYKIGVIDLPSFYLDMEGLKLGLPDFKSTTRDVRKILEDFNAKGVDAVIFDLRRNGGGSLTEAISCTGLFIDEGPIVQVKDPNGRVQHYDDTDKGVAWSGPLIVLSSKFSASASEIFAGAIQDYGRGIVVGDRTSHGKGTVQSLMDVKDALFPGLRNVDAMGALKITIQQFYRPNGDSTQNRGVVSDIELPSLSTHLDVGEADLDYALKFDHVDPANFVNANQASKALLNELRNRSKARVDRSDDFKKIEKKITRYEEQKKRKAVSLNESKFMADRAELNADKEEEEEYKKLDESKGEKIKRDYYFDEAIAIAVDYLKINPVAASADVARCQRSLNGS
ncbi:MAG: carboxy terminal-processing peptidase [Pirellulales bacterium]|nr:carboxy terminal-processing peptidase [Pirellulales bacterium]